MTDIVFIAFEFPPLVLGGVFRPFHFARQLPFFGIRPHLYTLDPEDYHKMYPDFKLDEVLLSELKDENIILNKVPIDFVFEENKSRIARFLQIYFTIYRSNEYKAWKKYVLDKIRKDAASIKFKAVLITAPPFGMIKIGEEIARELNIPLILDMRDAWSLWTNVPYGSILHYLATRRREYKHFSFASKIIATTQQTADDWMQLHPGVEANKFVCISNGYDEEKEEIDFKPFAVAPLAEIEIFTVAYVGSFYYTPEVRKQMILPFYKKRGMKILHYFPRMQDWLYRTPHFFFKTLQRVFEKEPTLKNRIRIRFAGRKESWLTEMIDEFSLQGNVEHLGLVSHAESLRIQEEADGLLMTSAKLIGGRDCFVAGKTFEYLTMNKPILGFVTEGAQKDLLEKTGTTIFFDPDNTEAAASQFIQLLKNGRSFDPDAAYIKSFERKKLTSKLAGLIHQVIKDNGCNES